MKQQRNPIPATFGPRRIALIAGAVCLALAALALVVTRSWWNVSADDGHRHIPGTHGGIIVAVGHDHYHVEALFAEGGLFKLFTLGQDQTRVISVPSQTVTAYVRSPDNVDSVSVVLEPKPQSGDPPGETSQFEGQLPLELVGSQLLVVVPSITIGTNRYRFGFATRDQHESQMPRKVTDETERQLYLTPGGKYTAADIEANGSLTASQKYRGFRSTHDMHPAAGDTICPITGTKANPKCAWVIGGLNYTFCCPPCIDEFVKLAKEHPDQIQDPAGYAQQ